MAKGLFKRFVKAVATGGVSEIAKNKRLAKAILSGGASEVVRVGKKKLGNKDAALAILTGGGSVISRSAFNMFLKPKKG
jgi:hypothetical protein